MRKTRPTELRGLVVEVRDGDFNWALRKFKKKVQESGILQELKDREHYEKPSIRRKKAKASARARWLKKLEREEGLAPNPYSNKKRK